MGAISITEARQRVVLTHKRLGVGAAELAAMDQEHLRRRASCPAGWRAKHPLEPPFSHGAPRIPRTVHNTGGWFGTWRRQRHANKVNRRLERDWIRAGKPDYWTRTGIPNPYVHLGFTDER